MSWLLPVWTWTASQSAIRLDVMSWPEAPSAKWEKKGGTNRSWILWTASETPSTFCWRRMFSWFYTAVSGITQDSSNVDSHLTVLRLNIKDSWKPMWPYNHFVSALSIMSFYFIIVTFYLITLTIYLIISTFSFIILTFYLIIFTFYLMFMTVP